MVAEGSADEPKARFGDETVELFFADAEALGAAMSVSGHADPDLSDTLALISRSVRHSVRSLDAAMTAVLLPVLILLMFVYVFGGAIDVGAGRYVDYVVPGIILLCAGYGASTTAMGVNADMTTGVIDRFRSLPPATMPAALRWIGERQPITPIVDTLRALLGGTPVGDHAWIALAWCAGLTAAGVTAAALLFRRAS